MRSPGFRSRAATTTEARSAEWGNATTKCEARRTPACSKIASREASPKIAGLALPFQIGNRVHVQLDHDRRESRIAEQAVYRAAHPAVPDDHGEAIPRRDSPADLLRRVRVGLAPAAPRGR